MGACVSIIIPNYNGRMDLEECLESLDRLKFHDYEVIVVDNGSRDDSLDMLRERFPRHKVIALEANVGFAKANNLGFEVASGKYIVTLNNDTVADPAWLDHLVAAAESRPQVGMVSSLVLRYGAPEEIDSVGMLICRDGMSRGALRGENKACLGEGSIDEIFYPSACAALYKREMLDETGFFDETFFAYCEDTDLGLRGRWHGWKAVLAKEARVYHKYSRSSGGFSALKVFHVERNHYWVALKTFPLVDLLCLPFWTCVRLAFQVFLVLSSKGEGRHVRWSGAGLSLIGQEIKGMLAALPGLLRCVKARRSIRRHRRISDAEMKGYLASYRLSFSGLLKG